MRLLAVLILLSPLGFGQTCAPRSLLRPVDAITGSLGDADCRLSDGSLYAEYSLTLPTFGQLRLNAASDEFPVTVILRDSFGRKIEEGGAIQKTIERGEYSVLVNAQSAGQAGKFALSSTFEPEPNTICRSITRVGPNQVINGRLEDSSCRLPNEARYDGYVVRPFGSGTLEATVTWASSSGDIILRGEDGRWLASGPDSFSLTVLGDAAYTIIAAGANSAARGDYRLTLKFTPSEDEICRPQRTLLGSEDAAGTIVEDSCAFGAETRFHYYDLNVTAAGLADLRVVPGGAIATSLAILDASGRVIVEDVQSGGQNRPVVRQQLSPGNYSVLVASRQRVDYTLQYRFTSGLPSACPALELRTGTQSGSFDGSSSCRSVAAMQDVYRFSTTTVGRVDVAISSASFEGSLVLLDAKDNTLALGGSRVIADLAAGTYSLVALSDAAGNYSVNYTFTAQNLSGCPEPAKVPVNVRFRAFLGTGPCRGTDGQPIDSYEFTNSSPGLAAIFMTSAVVDGYLTLIDSQGTVLRRDDNSFRFPNDFGFPDGDMIVQWLPGGTYRINASGSGGLQTGQYQVDLLFVGGDRPAGCAPVGDLNPGVTQATLNITGCQYVDDTFADVYRLTLSEATKLDITMTSASFDSYLILLDEKGNVIDVDDDSGGGGSARLTSSIEAGTYYVVAKSFVDNGYTVGAYTLTVR